jgi:ribosomal protein S18 acetylase RimI-like enzyme
MSRSYEPHRLWPSLIRVQRSRELVRINAVAVRRAISGDEQTLRSLRLQAMTDAPDAFGSTYERELARTPQDWQRWIEPNPTFLFEAPGEEASGIVAAFREPDDLVHLTSMWVRPSARRAGVGDALVRAVIVWAAFEHARELRVWVMRENTPATRLYERNGFRPTGNQSARDRDGAIEIEMHRP